MRDFDVYFNVRMILSFNRKDLTDNTSITKTTNNAITKRQVLGVLCNISYIRVPEILKVIRMG